MDIGSIMNAMRDPAGVPAPPVLFQALMVLTWTLHIAFVHLTLGSAALAIFAFHRRGRGPYWERLSMAMTKAAKVGVSLLIVLGVAPLLFTQVIYDPQWYASNVLSGRWAIGFIFTLIIAYCSWFAFYAGNHEGANRFIGLYAWIALGLFVLDGLIMHALSYQSLLPSQWMDWYAPSGVVDTSGSRLHAIQWPRFGFLMSLSLPAIGLFLMAYSHYFSVRPDREPDYLAFVQSLGQRLATSGFVLSLLPLAAWQAALPAGSGLRVHPVGWMLMASVAAMALWTHRRNPERAGYLPIFGGLGVLALLSLWREIIRIHHLRPLGYEITNYPVHMDWPSLFLFFSTLLGIGGLVGGFYLTLIYRAGRTQGRYLADSGMRRLSTAAVAILVIWIAVFFAYGITIWMRNRFV